jgi:peptidoglycan/xylan/chitin deacetylase (PgdA/CDA1 family)
VALNFFRSPYLLTKLYPSLVWRVPTEEKSLYLTFDDGPVPGPTEFVLAELKKVNAKATFFCIGDNVKKHPQVFEKIKIEGHAVGNHTFNHLKGWNYSLEEYLKNTKLCSDTIGGGDIFFRPPYGRIKSSQIHALKNRYKIIMWDVLTHDYSKNISRNNCLQGSISATREGSIIVFHDSLKAERNLMYVLPKFLEYFSSRGFIFKSLPDNL